MIEDLTDAITDCAVKGPVVVTRTKSVSTDHGRKADPVTEQFPIVAAITPLTGKDMRRLGDGFVAEGTHLILTETELLTTDSSSCRVPDVVNHKEINYQISRVLDWSEQGNYYECVGTRLNR